MVFTQGKNAIIRLMTKSIFTNYIYNIDVYQLMHEVYLKDEIYKNISESHEDVSLFVNGLLKQYLEAFKAESEPFSYTRHGNGD
jgi:hypothetical protein